MRPSKMSLVALMLVGCGTAGELGEPHVASSPGSSPQVPIVIVTGTPAPARWVGVSPESDAILASGGDTYVGIWIEVPKTEPDGPRAPIDLALVVDTSGSMQGQKIENARVAARTLASSLPDGDIVSVLSFADAASAVAPPSRLEPETRTWLSSVISELHAEGGTNMAAGLLLGQSHLARAPATHPVRRLVLISDGQANVGPSSPEALGAIAERGLAYGAQVTSMGVGNDYDERTLNAIAVRANGRLYHLPENQEMASILRREIEILGGTLASEATVVVAPGEGVQILGGDDANLSVPGEGGTLMLPIGTLFRGQQREALVRLRVAPGRAAGARGLVSVRLHYRSVGGAGHVQEVAARAEPVADASIVRARANGRAHAIAAVYEANRAKIQAAQELTRGDAQAAEQRLEHAAEVLVQEASVAIDAPTKQRLEREAEQTRRQQKATKAAAKAPASVQRGQALELNAPAASPMGR
jgi:Ca-activated chloride channel family protein